MDKELFSPIMDKNEVIIKTYRPNKLRAWFNAVVMMLIFTLFFVPVVVGTINEVSYLGLGIVLGAYILILVLIAVFEILWLNKTRYAVTNKRIIIRTGFIGVDFKGLDFTMLSALTVSVTLLDKIKRDTGSISFGSMASPMINNAGAKFSFSFVVNPYETYKEIKEIIDEHQSK